MDLELYQQLLRRYWPVFIGIVGVTILASWLFTARATASPVQLGTLFVSVAQRPETGVEQQYGEFYNVQGSGLLAEFFAGWLQDPATVQEVHRLADRPVPTSSLRSLMRFYDLKLRGKSGVQITLERTDAIEVRSLLEATGNVLESRFSALQQQGLYPDTMLMIGDVAVGPTIPNLKLNLAIGALAGLFLGTLALLGLSLTLPRRP